MKEFALFIAYWSAIFGFVFVAMSCSPTRPRPGEAQADVQHMEFVRHPNGLCFGVIRFATYAGYQGASITHVPDTACAK